MMKECFKQEFVDAEKFKECASCPIFEECTQSVYLKGAKGAALAGEILGFVLGFLGLGLGAAWLSEMPAGAPWLILVSLVYLLAVYRSRHEYGTRNQEMMDHALHTAESKPAVAAGTGYPAH